MARGLDWGFRFIADAGLRDPLPTYESAFFANRDAPTVYEKTTAGLAIRFRDPEGRFDRSGRVIAHDFVVIDPGSLDIQDLAGAEAKLWPLVQGFYADNWDKSPPSKFSPV